jgi:hypothetical protein
VPRLARRLPLLGGLLGDLFDRDKRDAALAGVADSLCEVARVVRQRAPRARVLFVDYLTLLPPSGTPAPPLSSADADLARHVGMTLERLTAAAAVATGCGIVKAGEASRGHHPWSCDPWTAKLAFPLFGRAAPFHPNAAGMRAVAELVAAQAAFTAS